MDRFNPYIDMIDVGYWREMCVREGELHHYDADEIFIDAGTVGRYMGYVKSGTLKYLAVDSRGVEHVMNFEFPGGFASSFPDSILGLPSKVSIVANTGCDIYRLPTYRLRERLQNDPEFEFIVAKTTQQLFGQIYSGLIESYTVSPRERYEQLIARYPEIFESFQLRDVASYLRITPTHLSRIRKSRRP